MALGHMFEANKWARQTAIVVLIHAATLIILKVSGVPSLQGLGIALISAGLAIGGIHRSASNMMFKGEKWKDEASVTLVMLAIVTFLLGPLFPITLGIMHALVWYIRKKTGGDRMPMPITEEKIGSPF